MVVSQYISDGYKALYYILKHDHYAFMESPSTLISSYPRQQPQETTIGEYFQRFTDHLYLKAFIEPYFRLSMGDDAILDVFLDGAPHREFLIREVRIGRSDATIKARDYSHHSVLDTLERRLMVPDVPKRSARTVPLPPQDDPQRAAFDTMLSPPAPRPAPLVLHTLSSFLLPIHPLCMSLRLTLRMSPTQTIYQPMRHLRHSEWVYTLSRGTDVAAASRPCVVCKAVGRPSNSHTFKDCPVMRDDSFFKSSLIKLCSLISQQQHRAAATPVKHVLTNTSSADDGGDDVVGDGHIAISSSTASDFQWAVHIVR